MMDTSVNMATNERKDAPEEDKATGKEKVGSTVGVDWVCCFIFFHNTITINVKKDRSVILFIYLFGVLHRFQHCTGHITTNYQLSHLRPCREPNPGLSGGRQECYHSATMAPVIL